MIGYFRKYTVLYFAITFGAIIVCVVVLSLIKGSLSIDILPLIITCFLAALLGIFIVTPLAQRETNKIAMILLADCDPQSYLTESAGLMKRIKIVDTMWDANIVNLRSLAFLELDDLYNAQIAYAMIFTGWEDAKKPLIKAQIIYCSLSSALRIKGVDECRRLCLYSQEEFQKQKNPHAFTQYRTVIAKNFALFDALDSGDVKQIASLYEERYHDETMPMYTRVNSAYKAAEAYRILERAPEERNALEFVVKNGNKLACVPHASVRHEELCSQ